MGKRLTLSKFIERGKEIHGDLYNYSSVVYTNMHTKVKIIDPDYGEFWQTPMGHIQNGQGHRLRGILKASNKRRTSTDEFIKEANRIHLNLYDYSKVEYIHCDKAVCIIDPDYGEFWQTPYNHLRNHGCPKRTKNRKWLIHEDHIIPISILYTHNRYQSWVKDRPLYIFLNSDINLVKIPAKMNNEKSDKIIINDKEIYASSVRNNYDVIKFLCLELLKKDISDIIEEDKKYINNYFGIN